MLQSTSTSQADLNNSNIKADLIYQISLRTNVQEVYLTRRTGYESREESQPIVHPEQIWVGRPHSAKR